MCQPSTHPSGIYQYCEHLPTFFTPPCYLTVLHTITVIITKPSTSCSIPWWVLPRMMGPPVAKYAWKRVDNPWAEEVLAGRDSAVLQYECQGILTILACLLPTMVQVLTQEGYHAPRCPVGRIVDPWAREDPCGCCHQMSAGKWPHTMKQMILNLHLATTTVIALACRSRQE